MAFDETAYTKPAIQGDLAGLAIKTCVALSQISKALHKLQHQEDISEEISVIMAKGKEIEGLFDELVGWTPDER